MWSLAEFNPPATDFTAKGVAGFSTDTLEDRWILSRFNRVAQEVHEALDTYRFHEAAHVIYHFFWGEYCDWYLELIKSRLAAERSRAGPRGLRQPDWHLRSVRCACCRRSCRSSPKKSGTRCTTAIRR